MKEVVKAEKKAVPIPVVGLVLLVWERLTPVRRLLWWVARQVWVTGVLVVTNVDLQESTTASTQTAGESSDFLRKSDLFRLTPVELKKRSHNG